MAAGALAHLAPAAACWRQARNRILPGLAGVGRPDHVALTFDDGPDPRTTPAFLDALDGLGWKATFFLVGSRVRTAPAVAAEIVRRGHEVAVHGEVHSNHLRRTAAWTTGDVARALDVVAETTGATPAWFRPPYGALAASSLVAARRTGLRPVLWTTWGRDWRPGSTPDGVAWEVAGSWYPGATVLLHDTDAMCAPGSWRAALGALPILAGRWEAEGLAVGPLADHGVIPVPV